MRKDIFYESEGKLETVCGNFSGMDYNNGCYRFTVKTTVKRKDALSHDELAELCTRLCAVCIDVCLEGEKDYCWTVFYTTVT